MITNLLNMLFSHKISGMFTHHVLFWLKANTSEKQKVEFRAALESLKKVETVKAIYVGTPASTDRPVIDRSYEFSLLLIFDDVAGHDVYQVHPVHTDFVDGFKQFFDKVLIYDSE